MLHVTSRVSISLISGFLFKLMLGFYQPVEGEVLLGGTTFSRYSPVCWRKEVGVVMQEGTVFSNTIAQNLSLIHI